MVWILLPWWLGERYGYLCHEPWIGCKLQCTHEPNKAEWMLFSLVEAALCHQTANWLGTCACGAADTDTNNTIPPGGQLHCPIYIQQINCRIFDLLTLVLSGSGWTITSVFFENISVTDYRGQMIKWEKDGSILKMCIRMSLRSIVCQFLMLQVRGAVREKRAQFLVLLQSSSSRMPMRPWWGCRNESLPSSYVVELLLRLPQPAVPALCLPWVTLPRCGKRVHWWTDTLPVFSTSSSRSSKTSSHRGNQHK